jgi:hypothetical protein
VCCTRLVGSRTACQPARAPATARGLCDADACAAAALRRAGALVSDGRSTETDFQKLTIQPLSLFVADKPSGRQIAREPLDDELWLSNLSSLLVANKPAGRQIAREPLELITARAGGPARRRAGSPAHKRDERDGRGALAGLRARRVVAERRVLRRCHAGRHLRRCASSSCTSGSTSSSGSTSLASTRSRRQSA